MDRIRHTAFIIYSHCYITGAGKSYTHQSMFWSDLGPDVGYEAIGKYYYLHVLTLFKSTWNVKSPIIPGFESRPRASPQCG